jgi:cyanophycinase
MLFYFKTFLNYNMLQKCSFFFFVFLFSLTSNAIFAQSTNGDHPNPFFNSKGKLIIIGGGTIPDSLFSFFAEDCGGKDQLIVYIPTATDDETFIQNGEHLLKFSSRGFTNLATIHTRNKKEADDPKNIALMRKAKGLFFGGGDQDLIAAAYAGTKLYDEFIALLDRGGVIMGTSAGATIMGSLLIGGDARKDLTKPYAFQPAFSFMQHTAIDQHVLARNRQFDLIPVIENNSNTLGVGLDESTAMLVEAGKFKIWGLSYAMIYDPADWEMQKKQWGRVVKPFKMMSSGEIFNLVTRKIEPSTIAID